MNDNQKQRLERNLSKSASGAKPYWPRVLIGPNVEEQGYIDPKLLPIVKNENLGEFHIRMGKEYKQLKDGLDLAMGSIRALAEDNERLREAFKVLESRIENLEGFNLD